jgi:hypothetical protein
MDCHFKNKGFQMKNPAIFFLLGLAMLPLFAVAKDQSRRITTAHENGKWVINGQIHQVTINESDLNMVVRDNGRSWPLVSGQEPELSVVQGTLSSCCLLDAAERIIVPFHIGYKTGVRISLDHFVKDGVELDFSIMLFVCLEGDDEDLVCEIIAQERKALIQQCLWPKALDPKQSDSLVMPFMQGMLLPRDWPTKVWLYNEHCHSRGFYMPWWGHLQADAAMMVLLETPDDGGCSFQHPAGGPTLIQTRWYNSLGKFSYPRRVRFCFFRHGGYVTLAKRYRRYVHEKGQLVLLREKIARTPLLEKLIGAPVIHTSILYHIQPRSSYYDSVNLDKNNQLVTFGDRAAQLRRLAGQGVKKAYLHLDGWGLRGYDNLHPDILPPCLEAGGWDGMRRFADTCDSLHFVFAVHDQYRDYYLDAASYDVQHTVLLADGSHDFGHTWYGGDQSLLCSQLAPGYVRRNYHELIGHAIKLRGAYLDVFAVVPGDECYNPQHPVTRSGCLANRAECFNFIRSFGGIISSEEPCDWAVPYLDLVHHGPYALDPNPGKGPAMGIPIPLFNLVYHDAILLPWSKGKGEWGIPEKDSGFLHGLLNAGLPYLSLDPNAAELAKVETMCSLHQRVGMLEMTNHEFLDDGYRRQRTTFSDGTQVTVNLDDDSFTISLPLKR